MSPSSSVMLAFRSAVRVLFGAPAGFCFAAARVTFSFERSGPSLRDSETLSASVASFALTKQCCLSVLSWGTHPTPTLKPRACFQGFWHKAWAKVGFGHWTVWRIRVLVQTNGDPTLPVAERPDRRQIPEAICCLKDCLNQSIGA